MKTSVIEVHGMLSVFSVDEVERRIRDVPGVESATVNFAAGSATVRYDETRLEIADIKSRVRQREFDSAAHLAGSSGDGHEGPAVSGAPPATVAHVPASNEQNNAAPIAQSSAPAAVAAKAPVLDPAATKTIPITASAAAPAISKEHEGHAVPAQPAMSANMAHEMGHSGKDLPAMVRDMRNRFWICLIFSVPIFVYAPMGGMFKPPTPPFGLQLNLWLFFLASAAILYPSWPFFVSAWRALKTRTLGMAALIVLSVGTGYLFSVGTTFFFKEGGQFFEAVSVLLVFILLGHWLEMRARGHQGADGSHSGEGQRHAQWRRS